MKKSLLLSAVILLSVHVYSQSTSVIKNYEKGTKAIKSKKYQEGISYLNLSIEEYPTPDAYFNRAVAYYSLGDTCSFCNDLKSASKMNDQAADQLFREKCTFKVTANDIPEPLHVKYPSLKRVEVNFNLCDKDSTVVFIHEYEGYEYESSKITEIDESSVFAIVEESPEFPGGEDARNRFLAYNIIYPEIATRNGIQGTVYISFVINFEGNVTDVKVLRGIGGGCDEEAVRVVKLMPKWKPGRQKGKAVSVRYNMPIQFGLGGLPENQPDKYMNQALKSMKNGDTCKSCAELYEARLYGNSYAAKLYEQICFRHDTIREINDSLRKEIPGLNYIVAGYAKCKADTSYAYFNANMERITAIVETAPEFPGGDHGRMVYLQNTMKYPQEAREQGIQGTVYVTFTIDTDGSITDIAVLKSPHILLSEEAVRVVKLMPKWKPGTQRGKPVKVQINMPLAFTLSH